MTPPVFLDASASSTVVKPRSHSTPRGFRANAAIGRLEIRIGTAVGSTEFSRGSIKSVQDFPSPSGRTEHEWDVMIDAVMPSPERLRELARKCPPPPEWFDRDEPCPFS